MSLINDALKQARKDPPADAPSGPAPLQPVPSQPSGVPAWLLPSVIILLVVTAIFFIGWAVMHKNTSPVIAQGTPTQVSQPAPAPQAASVPQQSSNVPSAVVQTPTTVAPQPPANPPFVLKLQGIDYSAKSPSAILNGKTVHPGDVFHDYQVKTISQDSVILIGPDNKQVQIQMGN